MDVMLAVLLPTLALAASAAPDLGVLHQYASVALSADGQQIAAVETVRQPYATTEQHGAVVVRGNDGAIRARLDPCAKCKYAGVTWSPDGRTVVFTGSADGVATLYGAAPDPTQKGGFVARRIVELKGLIDSPRWSPDGRSIAVLATAGAHKESGAIQAGAREIGEIG
jgi:dipeptidyl aminopeptidase/acylaminoacyl peptidase